MKISKKMNCANCLKEIERKTGNQKYCYFCNGIVSRQQNKENKFLKRNNNKTNNKEFHD